MNQLPLILAREQQGPTLTLQLRIGPELEVFQGHFDGAPLVPGVAQVDWALRWASSLLGVSHGFQQLLNLKFLRVMRGNAELSLALTLDPGHQPPRLNFCYSDALGVYSQGTAVFG